MLILGGFIMRTSILICCFFLAGCSTLSNNFSSEMAFKSESKRSVASVEPLCGELHMNNGSPYLSGLRTRDDEQIWFFENDDQASSHQAFASLLEYYKKMRFWAYHGICFRNPEIITSKDGSRKILSNWSGLPGAWSTCLVAGTLISTPSGQVPIEDIKVGDLVLSFDGEKIVESKVLKTIMTPDSLYGHVELPNGKTLGVTAYHPFYDTLSKEWFEIGEMDGSQVLGELKEGSIHPLSNVKVDFSTEHRGTVYNIEVDSSHNYFAENILVHNK